MAYIYVITNNINGKQYVGKTNRTIEKRFQEHINDKDRREFEIRPLYRAFNKYGVENFSIKILEECLPEESSNKEIYWINKLDTYHKGYNATLGGDGKVLYDYKELADKYLELQSIKEVCNFYKCDGKVVKNACEAYQIEIKTCQEINKEKRSKKVYMKTLDNVFICSFYSLHEAARYCVTNKLTNCKLSTARTHISEVCRGKRKTFAKYKWEFE